MPKRVIDFDAMWGSDKLAACAEWAQAEYAWLYGLADASGCFELTNLRVIWGRVAAIRKNLTIERLEQILDEFQDKGLLFVWEHEGKRYGHWTGSDVPGRLPPPSWRMRLEHFAPPVPKQRLAEYMSKYARGRAALAGVGFRDEAQFSAQGELARPAGKVNFKCEISNLKPNSEPRSRQEENLDCRVSSAKANLSHEARDGGAAWRPCRACQESQAAQNIQESLNPCAGTGLKDGLEAAQAQDLDWNLGWNERKGGSRVESGDAGASAKNTNQQQILNTPSRFHSNSNASSSYRDKDLAVQRELRVGQGPVCAPASVRPEILERIRRREAARAGSRSP